MEKKVKIKNKKRFIILTVIIVIAIVAIVCIAINVIKLGQANDSGNLTSDNTKEEFTKVDENGLIVNTSDKLSSTKTFEEYELTNIKMSKEDNTTRISAEIKNITDQATPFQMFKITLIDKNGNEIQTISCAVKELKPGESTNINTSASYDFINAYDFKISK